MDAKIQKYQDETYLLCVKSLKLLN